MFGLQASGIKTVFQLVACTKSVHGSTSRWLGTHICECVQQDQINIINHIHCPGYSHLIDSCPSVGITLNKEMPIATHVGTFSDVRVKG